MKAELITHMGFSNYRSLTPTGRWKIVKTNGNKELFIEASHEAFDYEVSFFEIIKSIFTFNKPITEKKYISTNWYCENKLTIKVSYPVQECCNETK